MYAFRAAFEAKDAREPPDYKNEAGERVESARLSRRAIVSDAVLRKDLAKDLSNLLNTVNLGSATDIEEYEHVKTSILNYGIPDPTRFSVGERTAIDIGRELVNALMTFEPRLAKETIELETQEDKENSDAKLSFLVRAEMFSNPVNVPMEFVADLEFDTGKIQINRL